MSSIATQPKPMSAHADNAAAAPAGYKRTEVGAIPEKWDVRRLSECLRKPPRYGINAPAVTYDDALPTYLRITDIDEDGRFAPAPRVSVRHADAAAYYLEEGDLVFARTGASVGKSYLYRPTDGPLVFAGFLICVKPARSILDPTFLSYYVQSKAYWDWVRMMSVRSGQPGINGQEYGFLELPVPHPDEQHVIATALSDVDRLIEALDKLIAKKRAIKQAAMQQLLTGKTRPPGFEGEWEVKRFGVFASPRRERIDPRRAGVQEFCVELEHIEQGTGQLVGSTSAGTESSLKSVFEAGDVLFGKLRAYLRKFWLANRRGVCSTEIWALVPDRQLVTPGFLFQLVTVDRFIETASTAYGTHMPRSDWNVVKNYEAALPRLEEQTAIATVLSDMDAEIATLERRRDKIKAIKQGMMQALLSGRVRLVKPVAKA